MEKNREFWWKNENEFFNLFLWNIEGLHFSKTKMQE